MDNKFSFWYPVLIEKQLDFEGKPHFHDVFLTGHIVYSGRLMCGETREVLKNKAGAHKEKNAPTRLPKISICPVCLEEWKNCPESEWYKFTHALPVQTVGIEIISKDVSNEAKIQEEVAASV